MCTLDGRGFCIIPGLHCPHDVGDDPGHIYSLEEAITISGPPSEDRGGPSHLSDGNDYGRAKLWNTIRPGPRVRVNSAMAHAVCC
jgi:hypothetical protein